MNAREVIVIFHSLDGVVVKKYLKLFLILASLACTLIGGFDRSQCCALDPVVISHLFARTVLVHWVSHSMFSIPRCSPTSPKKLHGHAEILVQKILAQENQEEQCRKRQAPE
jgi:hypothetical protein